MIVLLICSALSPARAEEVAADSSGQDVRNQPVENAQSASLMPEREQELIDLFLRARKRYVSGKPGTFAKDVRLDMQVELFRFMKAGQDVQDWVGTVKGHGTTPEGDTWLVIEIADGITLGTWKARANDAVEQTLLHPFSPLHKLAAKATMGEPVIFSGRIIASMNDTDDAMISRPQLIARFKDLRIDKSR